MDEIIISDQGTLEYSKKLNSELLQPNQISQGLYKCSPLAKQLLAYVIADLKIMKWSNLNIETYETTFKTSDFVKALGKSRIGAKQKDLIKSALVELQKSYIAIDTGKKFETFSWVTHAVFSDVDHKINIEINHHLGQALVEYKHGFTTLQLIELGRLQSFYAMRYYEIALSWIGKKGRHRQGRLHHRRPHHRPLPHPHRQHLPRRQRRPRPRHRLRHATGDARRRGQQRHQRRLLRRPQPRILTVRTTLLTTC